jgi:hypothetical protein
LKIDFLFHSEDYTTLEASDLWFIGIRRDEPPVLAACT